MAGDLKLGIRLTADGKGFAGEIRVGQKALDKFTGSTKAQTKAARRAASATREQGSVIKSLHGHVLRYGASGQVTGLDYAGCRAAVKALAFSWHKVFAGLQIMEAEVLASQS